MFLHLFLNKTETMRIILSFLILALPFFAVSQQIPVEKFNELEKRWTNNSDTVFLVNYWATWCKPCVEELPDFLKLNEEYKDKAFKMILVSLDFPKHIESRVKPFINSHNIAPQVVLLDDDANIWINKVNPNWDGSIPVTQIIQSNKKEFYGGTLNYDELKEIIKPKLK